MEDTKGLLGPSQFPACWSIAASTQAECFRSVLSVARKPKFNPGPLGNVRGLPGPLGMSIQLRVIDDLLCATHCSRHRG